MTGWRAFVAGYLFSRVVEWYVVWRAVIDGEIDRP